MAVNTSFNGSVSLEVSNSYYGDTLSGTTTVNAVNGVANFSGLSLNLSGTSDDPVVRSAALG